MSTERVEKTQELSDASDERIADGTESAEIEPSEDGKTSRRRFIATAGKTIAYAAPVVLLFKPKEAIAASGGGSAATPG